MTRKTYLPAAMAVMLAACGTAAEAGTPAPARSLTAPLYDSRGTQVGTVTLTDAGDSTRVAVAVTNVAPGTHGTHFHAVGQCQEPDFTTAGAHLNPTARQHGMRNPNGPHLGDLPNLTVGADRTGRMEATVLGRMQPGVAPLYDVDGTALVVHANADDMVTDPSGNSGGRIACAVVAAPSAQALR